jgi:hypothetical protein
MRALAFFAPLLSASALCGCIHEPRTTSLRVGGAPPDAAVTIYDRPIGAFGFVQKRGVALPPGKHRITVEKSGYFPWDKLVEAHEGDPPVILDVTLTKIPD